MGVWFTSDLHLGHRFVAGLRGFTDPAEHDELIAEQWRAVIRKGDDVWVLGDLAASAPGHALNILATLPGRKHLIAGNHDRCHPMHRDSHNQQRAYLDVFASVQAFARRKIGGEEVLLSHFPYEQDRDEPRHTQYRLRDEGAWLLHGHLHSDNDGAGREIHVGVDAWGMTPVDLDTIICVMDERRESAA